MVVLSLGRCRCRRPQSSISLRARGRAARRDSGGLSGHVRAGPGLHGAWPQGAPGAARPTGPLSTCPGRGQQVAGGAAGDHQQRRSRRSSRSSARSAAARPPASRSCCPAPTCTARSSCSSRRSPRRCQCRCAKTAKAAPADGLHIDDPLAVGVLRLPRPAAVAGLVQRRTEGPAVAQVGEPQLADAGAAIRARRERRADAVPARAVVRRPGQRRAVCGRAVPGVPGLADDGADDAAGAGADEGHRRRLEVRRRERAGRWSSTARVPLLDLSASFAPERGPGCCSAWLALGAVDDGELARPRPADVAAPGGCPPTIPAAPLRPPASTTAQPAAAKSACRVLRCRARCRIRSSEPGGGVERRHVAAPASRRSGRAD